MNPLCGLKLRLRRNERSVDVKMVDRCMFMFLLLQPSNLSRMLDTKTGLRIQASDARRLTWMSLRLSSSSFPAMISVWGGFPCNGPGWTMHLYDFA